VSKDVLYAAYVAHCGEINSHPKPLGDFTEQLQQLYPTIASGRRRVGDGEKRSYTYSGIRLSDAMARRAYARDTELEALTGVMEFKRDAGGWPIARNDGGDFYTA
jgi:hypothetical protein